MAQMTTTFGKSALTLTPPTCRKEFEQIKGTKWAKEIVIDYFTRTEEGWLLGPLVKMMTTICKENPTPGGLSHSYCLEVYYKIGNKNTHEHWFIKIPKSLQTVAMDERELTMYNTIFPRLQIFLSETLEEEVEVDIPIPIIYFSSFKGDGVHDCLVTENLCANRYFQVDRDTTKLAVMRAAMTALANVHGITFTFMKSLGGKQQLLEEFPTIKELILPKGKGIKKMVNACVLPFLMYLARIKPDIAQQVMFLAKFYKFLFLVYRDLQNDQELRKLMTLVHGDAKLDNFLFKSIGYEGNEKYTAMIIDWQGCCFDLVSNDLMWCLYGFIKNLPETGEMIHGFVEYSICHYWDELKRVIKSFGDKPADFQIPEDSGIASELVKKGFSLEFLKNAIIKPVLSIKNRELLCEWSEKVLKGEEVPLPPEGEIFKTETYSNFIYLFFKIATEVGVFAHIGKILFTHMKNAMFSDGKDASDDSDDEEEVNEKAENTEENKNNVENENNPSDMKNGIADSSDKENTSDVISSSNHVNGESHASDNIENKNSEAARKEKGQPEESNPSENPDKTKETTQVIPETQSESSAGPEAPKDENSAAVDAIFNDS